MNYFAGLDGGSTYLKAALISERGIVGTKVISTGIDNSGNAERLIFSLAQEAEIKREDIKYIMATGYSRKGIDIADDDISEITAHAYGIRLTAPHGIKPGLIIDIGGQDSKLIYLDQQY